MWSPRYEPRACAGDVGPRPGIAHGPRTVMGGRGVADDCLMLPRTFESEQMANS